MRSSVTRFLIKNNASKRTVKQYLSSTEGRKPQSGIVYPVKISSPKKKAFFRHIKAEDPAGPSPADLNSKRH